MDHKKLTDISRFRGSSHVELEILLVVRIGSSRD